MKLIGDQVPVLLISSTKPPRHHWLKKRKSEVRHILEVQFGPQNCPNLQQSPRLHTESDWDVLALHGKITKSTLEWIQPHLHIFTEWAAIIDLLQRPFCPRIFLVVVSVNKGAACNHAMDVLVSLLFLLSRRI
jgi:hypothetical protein